jgi:hypothetical protein
MIDNSEYSDEMQQLKEALNFVDLIVGSFWGVTVVEIIPLIRTQSTVVFTQIDDVIKITFAFVGLIYALVRLIHFYKISKLNRDYREQEIIEKQNNNFRKKWDREFGIEEDKPTKTKNNE